MIKDSLDNAQIYYNLSENLKAGFEWLKSIDLNTIEQGKYYIDGDKIYANIQEYQTKTDAKYEAHRKYIDIQYVIKGNELVGVADRQYCTENSSDITPYDKDSDIEFFDCSINNKWQTLNSGEFLVLFPSDAHKPSISPDKSLNNTVKKAVVKVLI